MKNILKPSFLRWLAIGVGCAALGLGLLRVLVGIFAWPYGLATLVVTEVCTIVNFLAVDRWVFGHARPTWKRVGQYHLANAAGFGVGWGTANGLHLAGVHYLLASLLGTLLASGFSFLANFFWIWRKPRPDRP